MGDLRTRCRTFGGGTVLMFRYGHRLSKDIDIFVPDPQYLGYVTPRLSDTAASLTEHYTEMPGSFVKLQFEEGEIDFVAAPNLTDAAWEWWEIQGRPVRVETAAEVIAKKMVHRGDRATARGLFELAMVVEREPDALAAAGPYLVRDRDRFLEQIGRPGPGFRSSVKCCPLFPCQISARWKHSDASGGSTAERPNGNSDWLHRLFCPSSTSAHATRSLQPRSAPPNL